MPIRQAAINSRANDGLNGSDVFSTPNGKMLKDYLFNKFMDKNKTTFKGLIYKDNIGPWNGDDSQEFQSAQFLQLFQLSKQMLSEGKDFFTIKKEIDGQVKNLNAGRIKQILINAADSDLPEASARYMHDRVLPAMAALRACADHLEQITDRSCWPFPTYDELLFSIQ